MSVDQCGAAECPLPCFSGGYCRGHYRKWKKYGDPLAGRPICGEMMPTFLALAVMETDECLPWPGQCERGYGVLGSLRTRMGLNTNLVHRAALILRLGQPGFPNAEAAHMPKVCHNRSCMNYRHLYWGTRADNISDMLLDGTRATGVESRSAILTVEEIHAIKRLLLAGERSQASIGAEFGVSQGLISHIHRGTAYKKELAALAVLGA